MLRLVIVGLGAIAISSFVAGKVFCFAADSCDNRQMLSEIRAEQEAQEKKTLLQGYNSEKTQAHIREWASQR